MSEIKDLVTSAAEELLSDELDTQEVADSFVESQELADTIRLVNGICSAAFVDAIREHNVDPEWAADNLLPLAAREEGLRSYTEWQVEVAKLDLQGVENAS